MVVIYRGEDTNFAGLGSIKLKINTDLDLTGFTSKLFFGNVIKEFDSAETETKTLTFFFTAEETLGFFPGKGYATLKLYDTEGRVTILRKFVIDVRCRYAPIKPEEIHSEQIEILGGVTEKQLKEAMTLVKKYTDDKIEETKDTILTEQPVIVDVPGEEPVQMTVQQAVEKLVGVEKYIDKAEKTHLVGHVEDDTLYLNTEDYKP